MAKDEGGVLTTAFPFTFPLLTGEREVEDEAFCETKSFIPRGAQLCACQTCSAEFSDVPSFDGFDW